MRVTYFAHDLNDPGVARRIVMLAAGGLDVQATGFWRGSAPPSELAGAEIIPLGHTFDGWMSHRAFITLRHAATVDRLLERLRPADLFLAKNLEMLAIAAAARRKSARRVPLVYESLDIHRLLLGRGPLSRTLRSVERALMKETDLLITSSPAFLREHFASVQHGHPEVPSLIVENKIVLFADEVRPHLQEHVPMGPPWRIGWFGMIRCRRSLEMLGRLAARRPDLVNVEISGRAARPVRGHLEKHLKSGDALQFRGPYNTADLPDLYGGVHFSWAIDYFEENANSEWLLPNRIYEGGSFNVVPMGLGRTETGRWLRDRGLGVLFDDPVRQLEPFLESLTAEDYCNLKQASCNAPRSDFIADRADCSRLAWILMKTARRPQGSALWNKEAA